MCAECKTNPRPKAAPAPRDQPPPMPSPDDFVGRMIPTGNKPSLVAYYASIGSLIPLLGIVPGVIAIVFGVKGVRLVRRHPEVRGGIHAWFGLILGGVFTLVWIAALLFILVSSKRTL
jgi:hypothetical protein